MVERHPHVFGAEEVEGEPGAADGLGGSQGAGTRRQGRAAGRRRQPACGRAPRTPGADAPSSCKRAARARVRLDRRQARPASCARSWRSSRRRWPGARRPGGKRAGAGRSPVHRGEFGAAPGTRPRGGLTGHQRQVRAALPADRGRGRRPGSAGRRADLGRARGAVGAGQGRGGETARGHAAPGWAGTGGTTAGTKGTTRMHAASARLAAAVALALTMFAAPGASAGAGGSRSTSAAAPRPSRRSSSSRGRTPPRSRCRSTRPIGGR